jgi:hypothetical protein
MSTHDYRTQDVAASTLTSRDVLVGESGGLSAVYDSYPSAEMPGCLAVETEHGTLYLDGDEDCTVLHRDGQ